MRLSKKQKKKQHRQNLQNKTYLIRRYRKLYFQCLEKRVTISEILLKLR